MKKKISYLVMAAVMLSMTACGTDKAPSENGTGNDALLDQFLNGEIAAEYQDGTSFKITDLDIDENDVNCFSIGDQLDLDNDGENELILKNMYGGLYLDARDGAVYVFASGDSTTNELAYCMVDSVCWIYNYDMGNDDSAHYDFKRYEGGDNLAETKNFDIEDGEYYINDFTASKDEYYNSLANFIPDAIVEADWEALQDNYTPITAGEYDTFSITCDATDAEGFSNFDDFGDVLNADFTGTWFSPDWDEAFRLYEDGNCFAYMPGLDETGDTLYTWKIIDRSDRGLCPELCIYFGDSENEAYAYYIAGVRDGYFWCNTQCAVYYKQD